MLRGLHSSWEAINFKTQNVKSWHRTPLHLTEAKCYKNSFPSPQPKKVHPGETNEFTGLPDKVWVTGYLQVPVDAPPWIGHPEKSLRNREEGFLTGTAAEDALLGFPEVTRGGRVAGYSGKGLVILVTSPGGCD